MFRIRTVQFHADTLEPTVTASTQISAQTWEEACQIARQSFLSLYGLLKDHTDDTASIEVRSIYRSIVAPRPYYFAQFIQGSPESEYMHHQGITITFSVQTRMCGYRPEMGIEIYHLEGRYGPRDDGYYPEVAGEEETEYQCPCASRVCDGACGVLDCGNCYDICTCGAWSL